MNTTRSAYTLIELVVVIVILALAGALAVPAVVAWRSPSDLAAATTPMLSALHLARERAVSSGRETQLVIDPPSRRVWLRPQDTSFVLNLPDSCQLTGAARHVMRFAPDGPSHGTLPDVVCGAERAHVATDALTGLARATEAP